MVSSEQPISPRYTPCILISRIGSALPHRVNSQQTNSVDYVVYSRSHAFHDGNQTLRRKNPNTTGIEPSFFPPRGGRRTSTPPGGVHVANRRSQRQGDLHPTKRVFVLTRAHQYCGAKELGGFSRFWLRFALRNTRRGSCPKLFTP